MTLSSPPAPAAKAQGNSGIPATGAAPADARARGLVLTTLGFTFLGESLRDIFDPKLNRN